MDILYRGQLWQTCGKAPEKVILSIDNITAERMYGFYLEVADPVQPIGGQGSQDDQQTETDEDSEPDLVLACANADSHFLDETLESDVT